MKPLLIGQAPGPNTSPDLPLYPVPWSSSAGRLCKIMGLTRATYVQSFDRVNLLNTFPGRHKRDDKWPLHHGRIAASAMKPFLAGRDVIFIGRNVADAFGYPATELEFHEWDLCPKLFFSMACIPHPSGRNRWYSSAENLQKAQAFWAKTLQGWGIERKVLSLIPASI